jgi:hypothetical protein
MKLRNTTLTLALCCGMAFAGSASAASTAISLPGSSNGPVGVLLENKLPNLELAKSFTLLPGLSVSVSAGIGGVQYLHQTNVILTTPASPLPTLPGLAGL